jgi:hypothetical protein
MAEPKPDDTGDFENSPMAQTLRRMQKLAAEREAAAPATPEPPPPAKIIQFPLWPEPARGMPNPVLRSALFSAIHGKDRETCSGLPGRKCVLGREAESRPASTRKPHAHQLRGAVRRNRSRCDAAHTL